MENLKNLINLTVGTEGDLDIPAYWMNKILSVLQESIKATNNKIDDSSIEKGEGKNSAVLKGGNNVASSSNSSAFGLETNASGDASHAEGKRTTASGEYSHAEGNGTTASKLSSHAEGIRTTASEYGSHAEGIETTASGFGSHAEGFNTTASNMYSHAEGGNTISSATASHAEGLNTKANGDASHAEGKFTKTTNEAEHAQGTYNKSNTNTLHSVGIGTSDTDRRNTHEITNYGKHYIYGIGGYDGTNPTNATDLANAVVQTTPQALSDDAKNQVLANLGIADLLEAFKPIEIIETIPTGLVNQSDLDQIGLTYNKIDNILNGYTNTIIYCGSKYIIAHSNNLEGETEFAIVRFNYTQNYEYNSLDEIRFIKDPDSDNLWVIERVLL